MVDGKQCQGVCSRQNVSGGEGKGGRGCLGDQGASGTEGGVKAAFFALIDYPAPTIWSDALRSTQDSHPNHGVTAHRLIRRAGSLAQSPSRDQKRFEGREARLALPTCN